MQNMQNSKVPWDRARSPSRLRPESLWVAPEVPWGLRSPGRTQNAGSLIAREPRLLNLAYWILNRCCLAAAANPLQLLQKFTPLAGRSFRLPRLLTHITFAFPVRIAYRSNPGAKLF